MTDFAGNASPQGHASFLRLIIIQPTVPHYRVPLFEKLSGNKFFGVSVLASSSIGSSGPGSVSHTPDWGKFSHPCVAMLGGRILWQRGLSIPAECAEGDVLVVSGNPRFLSNWPLIWKARARGMGVIWWGHGWSPTSRPWRAYIRSRLMEIADVILLYTDLEARHMRARRPDGPYISATNNAIDQQPIQKAVHAWPSAALNEFRHSHGLNGKKIMLFCGRLRSNPSTGLSVAIEALSIICRERPEYRLVIIGEGEEGPRLRELADRLGVAKSIIWVGEVYAEERLAPWFILAACFVYPGAIGLSLMHAFGYGCPVITHDRVSEQNPEVAALRSGYNGLLFRRGDAADLAKKTLDICESVETRDRMAAAARETVAKDFSLGGMVDRFSDAVAVASTRGMHRASTRHSRL